MRGLRCVLLAAAVAAPAHGQTSPANQPGVADAIRVLFDQATFWRSQYQPQKADEALSRVLALDPQNADALALQAQSAIEAGDAAAAQRSLAQLRAARPNDLRIAAMEQAVEAGPPDMAAVEEARRLSNNDQPVAAIAAFRRAFHGAAPPPQLAREYYQTLAAVEGGWEPARTGLAALIRANPDDLRSQLAYATLLTYRFETRDEGLDRLSKLMAYPAIAQDAVASYRKVLFWLPSNPDSVPQYDVYLSRHPDDAEIAARETAAKNDLNAVRLAGYAAMQAGDMAAAEAAFNQALAGNPDDADAMIGMALTRFKQRRVAEGRALIRRAIEIDPAKRDDFARFLTGPTAGAGNGGGYGDPRQAGRVRAGYQRVAALTKQGDYAGAEALLRQLMGKRPTAGNDVQLGDIAASAGHTDDAVQSFRQALTLQPHNTLALAGLARALTQAGRFAEAEGVFNQAGAQGGRAGLAELARLRGEAYRVQAGSAADLDQRQALLREAVAADPADPWIRLELARMLLSQDRSTEGQVVMDAVTAGSATPDQLLAGVYYANEAGHLQQAGVLAARLPEGDRGPDIRRIQMRAAIEADLSGAHALGGPDAARNRLFELAAEPDPTGERVDAFARDLLNRGNRAGARELVRIALAARPATPAQRLAYAAVLLGANRPGDAKVVADRLQGQRLNSLQATQLAAVSDSIAVSSADALNDQGRSDAAMAALQPRLTANPDDPGLTMALGRVYQGERQPERALSLDESLLQRNPSSLDVRRSTISAALAAGDFSRAAALAAQTRSQFPDEPQAWIMSAEVAQARGEEGLALRDLRTARSLRQQQLKSGDQSSAAAPDEAATAAERGTWQRYAQLVPANTATDAGWGELPIEAPGSTDNAASDAGGDGITREYVPYTPPTTPPAPSPSRFAAALAPTLDEPAGAPDVADRSPGAAAPAAGVAADPILRDIDRSIAQLSNSIAPQASASLSLRGRSGTPGLEQLFEVAAPLEASYSPDGYGRLKVQVTPVYLYSGHINTQNLPRFGTNPLAGGLPQIDARNQSAYGTGLDVGYSFSPVSADIGVTPLGFQQRSITGGIEFAPLLLNRLTLRVVADRRAVTDSLLSYAGTEDPRSGIHWGGVTRNRVHAQLEGSVGETNYYAGGGFGYLIGTDVQSNTEVDAGAGFSTPVYSDDTKQVRLGLDLVYFSFDKNLAGFTIGQGGYYSPQQFFAALVPVSFRHQVTPDLVYDLGGSVGLQTFRDKSEPVFAGQTLLQSELESLAASEPALATRTGGTSAFGVAGGAHGDIDYRVTPLLHIGAQAGFDRSGPFTEGTGLIYARYVFKDPALLP